MYILALDQGTTSSRCIVYSRDGRAVSSAQREFTQYYPQPGWVEHDPMEIWSSQLSALSEATARAGIEPSEIRAVGVTNQRETTVVWNADTGQPLANAIVWQCRRTADMIDTLRLNERLYITERTGLAPDAYFSATKLRWILDNIYGARELAALGKLRFGTVDTWLMWKLSGGKIFATDVTNASRTMLFDIRKLRWDDDLLEFFDIPKSVLPEVYPSSHIFGETDRSLIGASIPIAAAAGDQHAALYGQCCFTRGEVKNTYGTGCFMLMNTGKTPVVSENRLLTTIAYADRDGVCYALEGSVFVAGALIQWLRDELKIIENAADTDAIARSVADSGGVAIVPAFVGLGAPYWNQHARGIITGLTRGAGRAHIVRAALESIACQSEAVCAAMGRDAGFEITSLKADGGASRNDFLMQCQADVLNAAVIRPQSVETTARGAMYLAGMATGMFSSKSELITISGGGTRFTPSMASEERKRLLAGYNAAVKAALHISDLLQFNDV